MQTAAEKTTSPKFPATFGLSRKGFSFSIPSTRLTHAFAFGISVWADLGQPVMSLFVFDDRAPVSSFYARNWSLLRTPTGRHTWVVRSGKFA